MLESMQEAFQNLLYWVPSGLVLLYILIKNNAWQRTLIHVGSLLALLVLHLLLFPLWGAAPLSLASLFVSLLFLSALLMWSGRTLFTSFCFLGALCFLYKEQETTVLMLSFGLNLLLAGVLYIVEMILSKRVEQEATHHVSGEYTEGGYLISDINLLLLFLFATAFAIVMTAVYAFMRM
jgi:hypothetical protein